MDSGACDHVIPPAKMFVGEIRENEAVKTGLTYHTASGAPLPNKGEVDLEGFTTEGAVIDLTTQVADVTKPLASVRKMCNAGNRVVFEENGDNDKCGGYVENIATGRRIPIAKNGGTYSVSLGRDTAKVNGQLCSVGALAAMGDEGEGPREGEGTSRSSTATTFRGPA